MTTQNTQRKYSFNVHWWDSNVVLGGAAVRRRSHGDRDVEVGGSDFADAMSNAVRLVEQDGHRVDQVTVNV